MGIPALYPEAVIQVENWLDSVDPALARRERDTEGKSIKEAIWWLEVPAADAHFRKVQLVLPFDFPLASPRILVSRDLWLAFPHVEPDGHVCLGVKLSPDDFRDPVRPVALALKQFEEFTELCKDAARCELEFFRERTTYWAKYCTHFVNPEAIAKPITRLYALIGRPVFSYQEIDVAIFKESSVAWAAHGLGSPADLAKRHRGITGTPEMAKALLLNMPDDYLWIPSRWPREFTELATLTSTLTSGKVDLHEWWLEQERGGAPYAFALLLQAGHIYAFRVLSRRSDSEQGFCIAPVSCTRADADWALARDHELGKLEARRAKHVVIIGCGSLGGAVSEILARAGIGRLTLVDNDLFWPENVSRHVLGLESVGRSKTEAVCTRLTRAVPGLNALPKFASASEMLLDAKNFEGAHCVVDLTGEQSVRLALAAHRLTHFPDALLVMGWMEPYGSAVHVVGICGKEKWPETDPAESHINIAKWPASTEVELPGCGSGFHPWGPADALQCAAFVAEKILQLMANDGAHSMVWSRIKAKSFFDTLPVKANIGNLVPDVGPAIQAVEISRSLAEAVNGSS